MLHFSVCIDAVMRDLEPAEAVRRCAALGAEAYEFWSWWDKDLAALERAQRETGLKLAAMCTRCGDLTDPAEREQYLEGLRESLPVARRLGCATLITQVGGDTGAPREEQHRSIAEGLRAAAPLLEAAGVTLAVEPLNTEIDHKGYYLTSSAEGFALVEEVGSPAVRLLFDLYHQQVTEGNLLNRLLPNLDRVRHIHAAGLPGRHELQNGEIHYPFLFQKLEEAGYQGYVGLEYVPLDTPETGLRPWLNQR